MFSIAEIRALFTTEEIESLRQLVREEVIPHLVSVISRHQEEIDEETDPDEWFAALNEVIETLETEFKDDEEALRELQRAGVDISIAIDEITEGRWSPEEEDSPYEDVSARTSRGTARSIFDDVDD